MKNKNLQTARENKNDEFYTKLSDIENELQHYKSHFKNKIIYCNCDDYSKSNFFKYFKDNFQELGLKKLITSNFVDQTNTLFPSRTPKKPIITEYEGYKIKIVSAIWDGDFRSPECIKILKQADIVVTNPPFSLFREYMQQLIKYDKKFLILGSLNAIKYKNIFQLIKKIKIWLGINNGVKKFDKQGKIESMGNVVWFTNLSIPPKQWLKLDKVYDPTKYSTFDNYGAINVNKVKDIPMDYDGEMGVPITFLDKFNPKQFDIIALPTSRSTFTPTKYYIKPYQISKNGNKIYEPVVNRVLVIEVETPPENKTYYVSSNSKYLVTPYARIVIKKKVKS